MRFKSTTRIEGGRVVTGFGWRVTGSQKRKAERDFGFWISDCGLFVNVKVKVKVNGGHRLQTAG